MQKSATYALISYCISDLLARESRVTGGGGDDGLGDPLGEYDWSGDAPLGECASNISIPLATGKIINFID